MTVTELVLVRHGRTEWSSAGRHTSFTDVPLDDVGRDQARALAPRLRGIALDLVLTSPRARARETCALAGLLDRAEITDDLTEWDYGSYEGRTLADIRGESPGWSIFTHGAPRGESVAAVAERADRVLARCAAAGGRTVLFSHGHFLRVLGARWAGLPAGDGRLLFLDTGSLSVLGREHEWRVVRSWNT
jgi:probable phosphoglycerate mutase